jgi:hypothetical protein
LSNVCLSSLTKTNESGRNILILCHGRNHPVVHTDLIDYEKDTAITIDINPKVNPHIVIDLSSEDCFKSIPDESIDIIIFHLCTCCTNGINKNIALGDESYRILKTSGELWIHGGNVESYSLVEKQSIPDSIITNPINWQNEKFHFIKGITSNKQDTVPIIRIHSNNHIYPRTYYLDIWRKKADIL